MTIDDYFFDTPTVPTAATPGPPTPAPEPHEPTPATPSRAILLDYQRRFIRLCDAERYVIVRKGRQSGFTMGLALWAVRRRLQKRTDCYYVSRVERSAKLFAKYCRMWAQIFNLVIREEVINLKDATTTTLTFPNGATIQVMPSGTDVVRGLVGDVLFDEAAYADDAAEFYDASFPSTQAGHSFIIISTVGYDGCWFNAQCDKASRGEGHFKLFDINMEQAVAEGLANIMPGDHRKLPPGPERDKAFIDFIKKGMTTEAYEQEYMARARGLGGLILPEEYDHQAVFPLYATLQEFVTARTEAKRPIGELFIGIDLAFTTDGAGLWVLERQYDPDPAVPDDQKTVYVSVVNQSWKKTTPSALKQILKQSLTHPNIVKVVVDQGGPGYVLALDLQQEFGDTVQPLAVSNATKGEVFERLKFFLQTDRLGLFKDQPPLRQEFMSIRRTLTPGGSVTYAYGTADGHGDNACACGYALYGAEHDRAGFNLALPTTLQQRSPQ